MTGSDIASLRKSLGLSQYALAKELGLHISTVYRWEQRPDRDIPSNKVRLVELVVREIKERRPPHD